MALINPSIIVDTTFSAKNIATAASVYDYTAAESGVIMINVWLNDAAGNGDYVIYLTKQHNSTGDTKVMLPKTTAAAASGETDIEFQTLKVFAKANDKISVMIDGLAGDTSVSGGIQIVAENFSLFDAANDTLPEVTAMQNDVTDILADTTTISATVATINANTTDMAPLVASIDTVTTKLNTMLQPSGLLSQFTADALELAPGGGTVNAYVAVSETVAAAVSTGSIGIQTYNSFAEAVSSTTTSDLSAATKLWFAVKQYENAPDVSSLIFLEETDGLTVVAQEPYATKTDGTLSVSGSSGDWDVNITLQEVVTGLLAGYVGVHYAEVKALVGGNTVLVWSGKAQISHGLIKAIT